MIVELLNLDLPVDAVLGSMLNSDGEVTAVVETAELGGRDVTLIERTSLGLLRCGLLLGLEEADCAATETLTLLQGC